MNRFATPFVAVVALVLAAAPAHAGYRSGVKSISAIPVSPAPETIHVYNDGNHFTHVTQSHVWFHAQTSVECKFKNDLMYTLLASGNVSTASGVLGPPQGPWGNVDSNGRQSSLKAPLAQLFAPPKANPAQMCNQEMDKRVAAGTASRFDLLQHGFDLLLRYDLTFLANCKFTGKGVGAELDSGGAGPGGTAWPMTSWDGWGSAGFSTYGTVRCEGGHQGSLTTRPAPPRPATNDLAVPFQVTRAALEVSPKKTTTQCPATLTANGSITVVGEGTVQYRVEHNGAFGPVQQMHFGAGDPKGKLVSFQLQVGAAPGAAPGKAAAGGGASGIGGLTQADAPKDKVRGSLRLVIVSPKAGVDHSNPTGYDVTCSSPPPPGPADLSGAPRRNNGGG